VWSLENTENDPWKDQVRRALSEVQGGGVDPDRVRKLQAYINLSVEKFLTEGSRRKAELESMRGMIRHLDEVLATQDAVSQVDRVREQIEIAPTLRLAAQLVESRRSPSRIEVSWPQQMPNVLGSNVNLKQVISNVFINAAEAIEAAGVAGHIRVQVTQTILEGCPAVDLAISDNGEGIDPAVLERIFEKGFSTRQRSSRGLGLHWCANAMNGMGGRIHAESEGRGKGTTVHLVLPIVAPSIADAA
jgi:two-component system NtrC family sensor kinase